MKLIRKASAVAGTAIALTAAGALTGVGLPSASAVMVGSGPDYVVMYLTQSDVQRIASSPLEAQNDCASFHYWYAPTWTGVPEVGPCAETLYQCAVMGNQAWTTVSVRFEADGDRVCVF